MFDLPESRTTQSERRVFFKLGFGEFYVMHVPEGTKWAPSVPQSVRPIFPIKESLWQGSLYHDILYRCKGDLSESDAELKTFDGTQWVQVQDVGRKFADRTLHKVMQMNDASLIYRNSVYWPVRFLGGPVWETDDLLPR